MSRLDDIFAALRRDGRAGLMPFITAGYPSLATTAQVIPALERASACAIEIGFPFSDPIADGPVIAAAMHEALASGVTPTAIFRTVASVRSTTSLGLIAMVSESIVFRVGARPFVEAAAESGFDGLIVPDLDTAAADELAILAREHDLALSLLIAPTTQPERIDSIVKQCSGFIYLLARTGLTGERESAPEIQHFQHRIAAIRNVSDLPIAVGFGVSTAEHVAAVTEHADAAIVGSALVRRMGEAADPVGAAVSLITDMARGLRGNNPAGAAAI